MTTTLIKSKDGRKDIIYAICPICYDIKIKIGNMSRAVSRASARAGYV